MTEKDLKSLRPLSIPYAGLNLAKDSAGNLKIHCGLRKKFVALTPEEFVRQNFVSFMIDHLGYPSSLMANEVTINLNDTKKRCDTVVFGIDGSPLMIVEYKAPDVEISQSTFDQIARYNVSLKAKYLVVTNGRNHYCCVFEPQSSNYHFIPMIPAYRDIV